MKPNYASPGPDQLACPACDTNMLGSPQPVPLFVQQCEAALLLRLGDLPVVLDGTLPAQFDHIVANTPADIVAEAALMLSGKLHCPVCGHHSDFRLERRTTDLVYSRYRLQQVEPAEAPNSGLNLMLQDLHVLNRVPLTLPPDDAKKDLSQITSLEDLLLLLERHVFQSGISAAAPAVSTEFYAGALVPLPPSQ